MWNKKKINKLISRTVKLTKYSTFVNVHHSNWSNSGGTEKILDPPDLKELYSIVLHETWITPKGQKVEYDNWTVSCNSIEEAENIYKKLLNVEGKINVPVVVKEKSFNV